MFHLLIVLLFSSTGLHATAQSEGFEPLATQDEVNSDWLMPRTEHGHPNFQGTWFFGSRTPLQRPKELGTQSTYTEQEVRALEQRMQMRLDNQAAPLEPSRDAPEKGAVIRQEADDSFLAHYLEPVVTPIAGQYRTSVIVDPPNGRIPPMREEFEDFYAKRSELGLGAADGPERATPVRPLLNFWGSYSKPDPHDDES